MEKKEIIEQYMKLPTGNVCDAMLHLDIPIGAITKLYPLDINQRRAVGFAYTVKQMQRHQAAEGQSLAMHGKLIDEELKEGDLMVIDVGGRIDVCTGGAILAQRAKQQGCTGYVINGALRDVKDIIDLDFPVHLAGVSPVKSSPLLQTVGVNIPVEIDGVQINPGDLIVTDDTGVVVVPASRIEDVLEEGLAILDKENGVMEMLDKGSDFASANAIYKL